MFKKTIVMDLSHSASLSQQTFIIYRAKSHFTSASSTHHPHVLSLSRSLTHITKQVMKEKDPSKFAERHAKKQPSLALNFEQ